MKRGSRERHACGTNLCQLSFGCCIFLSFLPHLNLRGCLFNSGPLRSIGSSLGSMMMWISRRIPDEKAKIKKKKTMKVLLVTHGRHTKKEVSFRSRDFSVYGLVVGSCKNAGCWACIVSHMQRLTWDYRQRVEHPRLDHGHLGDEITKKMTECSSRTSLL